MKPLEEMTFDELVQYCQGTIVLAIPTGKFNQAVWSACELTTRWRVLKDAQKPVAK